MALLLTTPDQHGFKDPTLELDEKRLKGWLSDLPVLNAGESLRMVLGALEPLNEQRLEVDKRLRLLAIYQATAKRLYDTAEPLRLRQQPLSRQQRQATVDDVERLCLAMANGFKIVIKELYAADQQQRDALGFGRVLAMALEQLGAALLHSYRFYRPEPPLVFLELNQLYRLARHHGLHEPREGAEKTGQVSLAGIYQTLCLMALTDPFSIEEGQADRYFRTLLQYAPQARIIPGDSWEGVPEGMYFVDLQSDIRPRHCVFLQPPVAADDPHILDARGPLQQMHHRLAGLAAEQRGRRSETAILRVLLPEVTPRDKRRSARRADGRWIEVVVGLARICDWLTQYRLGRQPAATRWRVKDASEQGYRLAWNESAASHLQVGELICVVGDSDQTGQSLQLLMVRWLCDEREQGTQLGVEKLSGVPNPVQVAVAASSDAEVHPALFIPSNEVQGSAARLLTPAQVYQENRSLLLYAGEREVPIQCAQLIEQAPGFDCFEFTSGD